MIALVANRSYQPDHHDEDGDRSSIFREKQCHKEAPLLLDYLAPLFQHFGFHSHPEDGQKIRYNIDSWWW